MNITCAQCAEPIRPAAAFCGKCGAARPADAAPIPLGLSVDLATLRRFEVGTRCMLRLRVENLGATAIARLEIRCEARGTGALAAVGGGPLRRLRAPARSPPALRALRDGP